METPHSWNRLAPERARRKLERRVAPEPPEAALRENFVRDTFASVADMGGHMKREDLEYALNRAGLRPTEIQLQSLWDRMDANRDGRASLIDFVRECGEVLAAAAFPRRECALGLQGHEIAPLELATIDHIPAYRSKESHEQRLAALREETLELVAEKEGMVARIECLFAAQGVRDMELEALRSKQDQTAELERELAAARGKKVELQVAHKEVLEENVMLRRRVTALGGDIGDLPHQRSAFSEEQEAVLLELQAQVIFVLVTARWAYVSYRDVRTAMHECAIISVARC
jgi:DNA repair exonuclease SbcCD ATPase subunit